jgi:hypothetical protein
MSENSDKIGVVRQHRWMNAEKQAELLGPRCNKVVSLGGKGARPIEREDLEKLARPGTVIELVHAFLLADPKRKRVRGGMKADFRAALERLEKRGAVVVDVDASICSRKHKRALLALVDADIGRSNQGLKSALNGARSRGRPKHEPTAEEMKDAKAAWRNVKDYPTWDDVKPVLPEGFTVYRAHKLWGPRK